MLSHEKCTRWQSFVDWRKINDKEMKPVMWWNSLNAVFRVERFKTRDNWVKTSNGSQIKTNKSANGKCLFQWRVTCLMWMSASGLLTSFFSPLFSRLSNHFVCISYYLFLFFLLFFIYLLFHFILSLLSFCLDFFSFNLFIYFGLFCVSLNVS